MNEEVLKKLAEILTDNVGQRLTVALANGIINTLAHSVAQARTDDPVEPPVEPK